LDSVSEIELASVSEEELVAEHRSSIEPASQIMAVSKDEPLVSYGAESSLIVSGAGEVASPVPRRPLVLMAFLIVATIALVLLLKACFVTQDDLSFPDGEQPAITGDGQALVSTTVNGGRVQAAKIMSQAPVSPSPDRSAKPNTALHVSSVNDTSYGQQKLMPIVVEAGLRLPIPVATADDILPAESPQDLGQSGRNEMASRNLAAKEGRNAVSAEIVVEQSWQETILVSFSFDSDDLVPDSHVVLERVATILRENDTSVASITGFTDSQGDSQYNLRLSRKRADAVERYLVDAGIARERLHVVGGGVLSNPIVGLVPGLEDPMEPYRIVQIKLVSEG
jgi:outer membrane protein OmpA-like peptidoglycan-associated protein